MGKLVYGVGVNDLNYSTRIMEEMDRIDGKRKRRLVWECPYYSTWKHMLCRCYSPVFKRKSPWYEGVSCTQEWFTASTFRLWMEEQNWRGRQLDKDILIPDNKVYSPDTCAFVLQTTNCFVLDRENARGCLPLGVTLLYGKYFQASCKSPFSSQRGYLGLFPDAQQAHEAWRKRKHELAQFVAETETDPRIVEALKKRYSYEEWYKHNPI